MIVSSSAEGTTPTPSQETVSQEVRETSPVSSTATATTVTTEPAVATTEKPSHRLNRFRDRPRFNGRNRVRRPTAPRSEANETTTQSTSATPPTGKESVLPVSLFASKHDINFNYSIILQIMIVHQFRNEIVLLDNGDSGQQLRNPLLKTNQKKPKTKIPKKKM